MIDLIYLMWLHLKKSVTPLLAHQLLNSFGSAERVYLADKCSYINQGLTNSQILADLMDKNIESADFEIKKANQLGISLLGFGVEGYPALLYEIADPPLILYVQGDTSVLQRRNIFCIVGTRRSTVYGMSASLGVAEQLARCGMIIISGVAVGIDAAAHRGAVRGGGKTIGIMGCGLDVDYPAENRDVRRQIIENGALISEFPFGTPPIPSNFPVRNRLLSAFSLGVAVMEAGEKSGALITAKYAAEQGRDVFALPGNISNPMSAGTNRLIQDGASLLTGAEVIITEYLMRYPEFFHLSETQDEQCGEAKDNKSKLEVSSLQRLQLSGTEKKIFSTLEKEPLHINEISRRAGISIAETLSTITILQIKGKVKEHPGNQFSV